MSPAEMQQLWKEVQAIQAVHAGQNAPAAAAATAKSDDTASSKPVTNGLPSPPTSVLSQISLPNGLPEPPGNYLCNYITFTNCVKKTS